MIAIFLFEFIAVYISWLILKKIFNTTKFYRIAIICCIISIIIGYTASYRSIGYQLGMHYLTEFNDQKIEMTGFGITPQEENEYKKELANNTEFQKFRTISAIKESGIPFVLIIFIMLFLAKKAKSKI